MGCPVAPTLFRQRQRVSMAIDAETLRWGNNTWPDRVEYVRRGRGGSWTSLSPFTCDPIQKSPLSSVNKYFCSKTSVFRIQHQLHQLFHGNEEIESLSVCPYRLALEMSGDPRAITVCRDLPGSHVEGLPDASTEAIRHSEMSSLTCVSQTYRRGAGGK